jgi:hypothetical protein
MLCRVVRLQFGLQFYPRPLPELRLLLPRKWTSRRAVCATGFDPKRTFLVSAVQAAQKLSGRLLPIEYSINETIDASVFERWRFDASYRPVNLVEWAKRYCLDIDSMTSSVRADARLTPLPE